MEVPRTLEEWTYDAVSELVRFGVSEDARFDFKGSEVLFSKDRAETLSKAASAFLNGDGGFLVIGVTKKDGAWRIDGAKPSVEIAKEFNDAVQVVPQASYPPPRTLPIPGSNNVLYVVYFPKGEAGPYASTAGNRTTFYRRTPSGSTQMDWYAIRDGMLRMEERRTRASMLIHEIVQGLLVVRAHQRNDLHREPLSVERIEMTTLRRIYEDVFPALDEQLTQAVAALLRQINRLNALTDMVATQATHGGRPSGDWLVSRNMCCSTVWDQAVITVKLLATKFGLPEPNINHQ